MDHDNGRRVLVTGGAGFIGVTLCQRLLAEGYEVVCLDNLFSGRRENVQLLLGDEHFSFMQADVCDAGVFEDLPAFTRIYNLACPASPPFYQSDPIHTMRTCVEGALNVLELARRTGARVLQTSTSEVYGNPLCHPQREDYRGNVNPCGPRACYDEGKRAAEALFFDYARTYGTQVRVVRIFNTFGPHMRVDDGRVITNYLAQALLGEDLTVYGDGSQTRSFCYVDDLVDGLLLMMEQDEVTGPVNLGNPDEHTMLELAQQIIQLTDSSSQIVFEPLPVDDPVRRRPDIALARERLGWMPTTGLAEGLIKTAVYLKEQIGV